MFPGISIVMAAGALLSGIVAAQASPFPMSVNETGLYQPEIHTAPATSGTRQLQTAIQTTEPGIPASTPFPVSVSEVGSNSVQAYLAPIDASSQMTHDQMLHRHELGSAAQAATVDKTVVVRPSDRYVNVEHLQHVRIMNAKGQSFLWTFDTLGEDHFPLKAIAPAGFDAGSTEVYVTHPESHRITG